MDLSELTGIEAAETVRLYSRITNRMYDYWQSKKPPRGYPKLASIELVDL